MNAINQRRVIRSVAGLALLVLMVAAGCDSHASSGEPGMEGRAATVEYRPALRGSDPSIQKQRSGKLKRVTADWVVLMEGTSEIWVPRDMVLEIRIDKP